VYHGERGEKKTSVEKEKEHTTPSREGGRKGVSSIEKGQLGREGSAGKGGRALDLREIGRREEEKRAFLLHEKKKGGGLETPCHGGREKKREGWR